MRSRGVVEFALGELAVEVAVEGLAVDGRIGGDDLESSRIGREREVPIGIKGLGVDALMPCIVEGGEAGKLRRNGLLRFRPRSPCAAHSPRRDAS